MILFRKLWFSYCLIQCQCFVCLPDKWSWMNEHCDLCAHARALYQSIEFWPKIIINIWSHMAKIIKSRVEIKHFSTVGLMSPDWVRTQVRTHSDFCWTREPGLGLWSNGLELGLWSNGLGLTPVGIGLWPDGLGLGLWPCGLGLTAGLTSPDSLQHWQIPLLKIIKCAVGVHLISNCVWLNQI